MAAIPPVGLPFRLDLLARSVALVHMSSACAVIVGSTCAVCPMCAKHRVSSGGIYFFFALDLDTVNALAYCLRSRN
jgi:hypothetical protein